VQEETNVVSKSVENSPESDSNEDSESQTSSLISVKPYCELNLQNQSKQTKLSVAVDFSISNKQERKLRNLKEQIYFVFNYYSLFLFHSVVPTSFDDKRQFLEGFANLLPQTGGMFISQNHRCV
jgi:hypothetical protein